MLKHVQTFELIQNGQHSLHVCLIWYFAIHKTTYVFQNTTCNNITSTGSRGVFYLQFRFPLTQFYVIQHSLLQSPYVGVIQWSNISTISTTKKTIEKSKYMYIIILHHNFQNLVVFLKIFFKSIFLVYW